MKKKVNQYLKVNKERSVEMWRRKDKFSSWELVRVWKGKIDVKEFENLAEPEKSNLQLL